MGSITLSHIAFCAIGYLILRSVYRLYFHPLRKFPGPRLAAISHFPDFYHDVVRRGMYFYEIEKMHQVYGPVVRITPNEIHINDPYYFDEIYASSGRKREKDPNYTPAFVHMHSALATVDHEHHRFRRGLLNPLFSKRAVTELLPLIENKISVFMSRLERACQNGSVISLDGAFAALTGDIISSYCFGRSLGCLEDEGFKNHVHANAHKISYLFHLNRFIPIMNVLMRVLPLWIVSSFNPNAEIMKDIVNSGYRGVTASVEKVGPEDAAHYERPKTIFHALMAPSVPAEEKTFSRIHDEAHIILMAGTETTARILSIAFYYLNTNKDILQRLREELIQAIPDRDRQVTWSQLEQLPYLSSVVKESLRISNVSSARVPRVAPDEPLVYGTHIIPPGTPISTSARFVHQNKTIFPNPQDFDPDRWIRAMKDGTNLDRYIVTFSKGSRMCLGMNLAYCELYLVIAQLVRWVNMELVNTTIENIRCVRDVAAGYPETGSVAVSARITTIMS